MAATSLNRSRLAQAHAAAPHIRSYFPEALYINPEIITDAQRQREHLHPDRRLHHHLAHGHACFHHAPARSGSGTSSLKVFQDFFVDLDLPVTLTQGDRVSIPVAIYNYSGKPGNVRLKLQT